MTQIAFCTALYEAARPYLPAFMCGIRAAARGHDACLVAAVDDLANPEQSLAELMDDLPVRIETSAAGSSPAGVRRTLLEQAVASGAEVLIFADMDDMLLANAPGNHLAALEGADFSYGDLSLMDAAGRDLQRRFFDGADVPWILNKSKTIARRNFLGLSNTAVRTDKLTAAALQVPDDVIAVDWWLFTTLLLAGRTGARTTAPVARYRIYDDNLLGAAIPATPEALQRTYAVMARHFRAFPAVPGLAVGRAMVEDLQARVAQTSPGHVAAQLASLRRRMGDRPGVWYEGLTELDLDAVEAAASIG